MHKPAVPYARLRRGLTALCAAALCSALPARGDDLQDASKFLKAGQHAQALERVNKALKAKPRDPQARFLKGIIVTEQGNSKEAIEIFTRLTQDYPDLPEPYNNLAVIYASQGQYEKARGALEQSIRRHTSHATAYAYLGDGYAQLASQACDQALQLDSSSTAAPHKRSHGTALGWRPARGLGKSPAHAHCRPEVDLGCRGLAQGDHEGAQSGERHVPADLPLRRAQGHQHHQDPHDGQGRRPLADSAGESELID